MSADDDRHYLSAAIRLGRRGMGQSWPNPNVGCIIVKDGVIVGRGWTQPGGRPHAETEALRRAGDQARGATAYVTLEPCAHTGRTPPCSKALIDAGVARVVASLIDPDPRVNGLGLDQLKHAGIPVESGLLAEQAHKLHAGYVMRQTKGRPSFTLKLAQSLDGRIATGSGQSQWITGPLARRYAHLLRARHDAILVGSGTVLADDPMLDCRIADMAGRSPVRIVLDRRLRMSPQSKLARTANDIPVWLITAQTDPAKRAPLEGMGVQILTYPSDGLAGLGHLLGQKMLTNVMIEGGGMLAASFIEACLIDRLDLVTGPMILGSDGRASIASLGLDHVDQASRWRCVHERPLGGDRLCVYHRTHQPA